LVVSITLFDIVSGVLNTGVVCVTLAVVGKETKVVVGKIDSGFASPMVFGVLKEVLATGVAWVTLVVVGKETSVVTGKIDSGYAGYAWLPKGVLCTVKLLQTGAKARHVRHVKGRCSSAM
jgi:hypothetical protein